MTVSELIDELAQYDPELDMGVVVSYKDPCDCKEYGGYCYCGYTDHEHCVESVSKEETNGVVKKLWIRGG